MDELGTIFSVIKFQCHSKQSYKFLTLLKSLDLEGYDSV